MTFSARKRYSDFEWLRETLIKNCPGVLVPQLPDKSFQNRFDESFIEHRRARLQKFLEKLFEKSYFQNHAVVKGWLSCPEYSVDSFKKEFSVKRIEDIVNDYKTLFSNLLNQPDILSTTAEDLAKDTTRLARFVNAHYEVITLMGKRLEGIFRARAAEQESTEELVTTLENLGITEKYAQHELASMHLPWRPRTEAAIKSILDGRKASNPHGGWEHLARAIRAESQDAKSLAEAIKSIQALEVQLEDREKELNKLNNAKGGFGSKVSSFFSNKDAIKDPQVLREKLTFEISIFTDFIISARRVLASMQGPEVLREMVQRYRSLCLALAEDRARTLKEESIQWDKLAEACREDGNVIPVGIDINSSVVLPLVPDAATSFQGPRGSELDNGLASLDDINQANLDEQ